MLEQETKEKFKMPGKVIYTFTKNVPQTYKEPGDFSLLNKTKPERNLKPKSGVVQQKTFHISKISGETDYFKSINRRF